MKLILISAFLTSSLCAFSATQITENCENKIIKSAEKMMAESDEITEFEAMEENQFVITYDMKDTCYGSIFVKIAPESCEIISIEEPYWPRCN